VDTGEGGTGAGWTSGDVVRVREVVVAELASGTHISMLGADFLRVQLANA
jgi:hypothetical protein